MQPLSAIDIAALCPQPVTRATLTKPGESPAIPLTVTLDPSTQHQQLSLPHPLPPPYGPRPSGQPSIPMKGVWRLDITTPCGCFTALVTVDCCPPGFIGLHTPTLARLDGEPEVECVPEPPPEP